MSGWPLEMTHPWLLMALAVLPLLVYFFYRSLADFPRWQRRLSWRRGCRRCDGLRGDPRCDTSRRQERAVPLASREPPKAQRQPLERSGKRTDALPHWREVAPEAAHRRGKPRRRDTLATGEPNLSGTQDSEGRLRRFRRFHQRPRKPPCPLSIKQLPCRRRLCRRCTS